MIHLRIEKININISNKIYFENYLLCYCLNSMYWNSGTFNMERNVT